MSFKENPSVNLEEDVNLQTPVLTVKTKPKLGSECTETDDDYFIELNLPANSATVLSGSGNQWTLSQIYLSSSIQELVIFDGNVQTQNFNETDLNMATYSSPKRVEIYTETGSSAAPYLVIQEVVSKGIQGWQFYAPVPFTITEPAGGTQSWTTAMSTQYVSIQQVKVYENCDYNIQQPPPPGTTPLFDMTAQNIIGEVDLQS